MTEKDVDAKVEAQARRRGPPRGSVRSKSRKPSPTQSVAHQSKRIERNSETVQVLLEAALDLFSKTNFSNVTIKNITDATGLNAALIYYYYKDKEDLFINTVEMAIKRAFDEFRGLGESTNSPEEIISRWLEAHIRQFDLLRKLVKVSIDYASGDARTDAVDQAIRGFYENERSVLLAAVREGIRLGTFSNVDPEEIVGLVSTFLDGVMARSMILSDFDVEAAIHNLHRFIMAHLSSDRVRLEEG